MSTFQIRATVHASANSPRAAAWAHFTTSGSLSISARKRIHYKSDKSNDVHTPTKLNRQNIWNKQLSNVNNNEEGQNVLYSLQSAAITNSPFEINNFGTGQTINERIESGSQSSSSTTSLSRLTTSPPLPFDDDENMPPQDFIIAHNEGYMYFYYIFNIT